jgi:hypothetical protein
LPTDDVDRALMRAWHLFVQDPSDDVDRELEALLPLLVTAGYADNEGDRYGFSPKGIARAEELEHEAETAGS